MLNFHQINFNNNCNLRVTKQNYKEFENKFQSQNLPYKPLSFTGNPDLLKNSKADVFTTPESRKKYFKESPFIQKLLNDGKLDENDLNSYCETKEIQFNHLDFLLKDDDIKNYIEQDKLDINDLIGFTHLKNPQLKQLVNILKNKNTKELIGQDKLNASNLINFSYIEGKPFGELPKLIENDDIKNLIQKELITEGDLLTLATLKNLKQLNITLANKGIKKLIDDYKITGETLYNLSNLPPSEFNTLINNSRIQQSIEKNRFTGCNFDSFITEKANEKEINGSIHLLENGFKLSISKLINFQRENPKTDLVKMCDYIKKINFKELEKIAPNVKDFNSLNKLYFANYHYSEGKTDFTIEDLQLKEDFTQYLSENFVDAKDMFKLYSAFPAQKREAGDLPADWIRHARVSDKSKLKDSLISGIDTFMKYEDIITFRKNLKSVFGRNVNVEELGSGYYGKVYKLTMKDAKPICLKLFYNKIKPYPTKQDNIHGGCIELQNGLFANSHSDKFVKVYLGRIGLNSKNDGFMITQYLEKGIQPEQTKKLPDAKNYIFIPKDKHSGNYVELKEGNIYIDLGEIAILNKITGEKITKF